MAEVIECRPISPRKINPQVPKDLETIIIKSISSEPEKRYRTAQEMSEDLQRFLDGQPIKARRISIAERFTKWTKRHPAIATLGCAIVMLIGLGMAGITWKWREAEANYREAMRQTQVREIYFSKALEAVDQMLLRGGSDKLANMPRMNQVRQDLLQDALPFYTAFLDESDNDPSLRADIGKVYRRTGDIPQRLGDHGKAVIAFQNSHDKFSQLHQQFPSNTNYLRDLAAANSSKASILLVLGKNAEAETRSTKAIELLKVGLAQITQADAPLEI